MSDIYEEIQEHREFQDIRWGVHDHPSGTGSRFYKDMADRAKERTRRNFKEGSGCWIDLLTEEYFEACAESDYKPLREELIQVAATVVAWIESLDRQNEIDI